MLFIVTMHAFQKVGWPVIAAVLSDLSSYPWYVLAPLGIVVFLATWRGLFMLISGAASIYGFQKAVQNGKPPHKVLLQRLIWSLILFCQGIAIQIFWGPYTGLYHIFIDTINPTAWLANLHWSDAVEVIAIGIFISSIIQYFLCLGKKRDKFWVSITVNLILAVAILALRSFLVSKILQLTEFSDIIQIQNGAYENFGDRMRLLGLALLIGQQQPLIPYLSATFLGNAFGLALSHPKINKKNFLRIGFLIGFLIIIASIIVGIFVENFEIVTSIVPNQWYFLVSLGIQVWILLLFIRIFDFSKKAKRRMKYTKLFRKAGILSLTIFSMQWIDYFPRWILQAISAKWGAGNNFVGFNGLELGNSLITAASVLTFWIIIIYLWSKINFTLSFDWIFVVGQKIIFRQKFTWKDPLQSQDIIHNAEQLFAESEPMDAINGET